MSQIFTAADLNTYAKKTLDAGLAAQVVLGTNQFVEDETHRVWGETKSVSERYDFNGAIIWLRNMDIQSITSVQLGWPGRTPTTLDPSAYFFEPNGRLTLLWNLVFGKNISPMWNGYITVTYTYGQMTIPDSLRLAALGFGLGFYNWANAGGHEVVASSAGSYRVEYITAVRGSQTGPTPYNNAGEANYLAIKRHEMPRL